MDAENRTEKRFRYRPSHRLSGRRAYSAVFREGKPFYARGLVVIARANGLPHMRLGLSVGRRMGKATARGRIKRVIRESFRRAADRPLGGLDLVVIPKIPTEVQDPDAVTARINRILKAAHRRLADDRP